MQAIEAVVHSGGDEIDAPLLGDRGAANILFFIEPQSRNARGYCGPVRCSPRRDSTVGVLASGMRCGLRVGVEYMFIRSGTVPVTIYC